MVKALSSGGRPRRLLPSLGVLMPIPATGLGLFVGHRPSGPAEAVLLALLCAALVGALLPVVRAARPWPLLQFALAEFAMGNLCAAAFDYWGLGAAALTVYFMTTAVSLGAALECGRRERRLLRLRPEWIVRGPRG